jgi:hypothetical protein
MYHEFFENLESRTLFSASIPHATLSADALTLDHAIVQSGTRPSLLGSYNGTLRIPAVSHNKSITLTISKQAKTGKFTGRLTSSNVVVSVSGTISANRTFTISLTGAHRGGPINATGTGTLDTAGRQLTMSLSFRVGAQRTPGSISVTKG